MPDAFCSSNADVEMERVFGLLSPPLAQLSDVLGNLAGAAQERTMRCFHVLDFPLNSTIVNHHLLEERWKCPVFLGVDVHSPAVVCAVFVAFIARWGSRSVQ